MKILITIAAFAASFLSASMLFAGGAGSSAGLTLAETISAQTAGISESATALSGSINLIASNPAAIHSLEGNQASINYRAGLGEDMLASLLYGRRFSFASLGIAVNCYSTGEITMYDLSGNAVKKRAKRYRAAFGRSAKVQWYSGRRESETHHIRNIRLYRYGFCGGCGPYSPV